MLTNNPISMVNSIIYHRPNPLNLLKRKKQNSDSPDNYYFYPNDYLTNRLKIGILRYRKVILKTMITILAFGNNNKKLNELKNIVLNAFPNSQIEGTNEKEGFHVAMYKSPDIILMDIPLLPPPAAWNYAGM
ncbi:hypothetical protein D1164_23115 [Mariniphaga sediminis]|uniref:Uncharacterized protein n=2 Tax=Mariniphaga sediminis TaxID=1628158 RepID=A0A399CT47_9BACT|nr:hypothetical protein D1164_23115 [Mariniphaga sediminis]